MGRIIFKFSEKPHKIKENLVHLWGRGRFSLDPPLQLKIVLQHSLNNIISFRFFIRRREMSEFGSSHWQTGRQPYCCVDPMMLKVYESVIDDPT